MSSLLEQAVIDAKALKEAAVKNAETKILEKYSQSIKEAVNSILDQGEDEELLDDEEETLAPELSGLEQETPGEETTAEVPNDGVEDKVSSAISADEEEIEIDLDQLSDLVNKELDGGEKEQDVTKTVADLKDVVVDLKDTVEDIKAATASPEVSPEETVTPNPDSIMEQEEDETGEEKKEPASAVEIAASSEVTKKETPSAKIEADMGSEQPEPYQWPRNKMGQKDDQEKRKVINSLKEEKNKLTEKNKQLEKELSKYKTAIKLMVEKVEEINLQNARLLYKNEALSSDSLNERQKQKIVEAVSKANSVKEAKLIFETLQNAIVEDSQARKSPKSLHEVKSRKDFPFVNGNKKESEDEDSGYKERMKKLAGLK
jgi:hypothetical protein